MFSDLVFMVMVRRLFVLAIQMSKVYIIKYDKSNQWSSICYRIRVISIIVIIVLSNV